MFVDCVTCAAPPRHCATCVVPAVLALETASPHETEDIHLPLDPQERRAVAAFLHHGMVDLAEVEGLHAVRPGRRTATMGVETCRVG